MKTPNSFLILMMLFISICSISAQNNEYTVITKSGKVFRIDRISTEPKSLKDGEKLHSFDKLKVGEDGYVVLADTNLQTIEISEEGIYNISELDTIITMKHNSISKNITNFILNEMSTNDEKYNEMKTLGAVVRKSESFIEPSVPNYGYIMDSMYTFNWHPSNNNTYIFRLYNQTGNTLFMKNVPDTSLTLNLSNFNLRYDEKYFWNIIDTSLKNQSKDSIWFILMSPNEKTILNNQIAELKADFLIDNSPLNYFIIAKFLKSKKINESAINYFDKIISLAPKIEFYWTEYIRFLMDVGLFKEAMELWNKSPFNIANTDSME